MGETLVFGMGATGGSCARYFARTGHPAVFCDTRPQPPASKEIRHAMPQARCFVNGALREIPAAVNRVVLSPGAPLRHPLVEQARGRGIPLISDLDIFAGENRARLAGITGSNGKSTVATLLLEMLRQAGLRASAGANLGTPALDMLAEPSDIRVLELSSFQLQRAAPIQLEAAVLLNIAPDHLDEHFDLESYAASKARIFLACAHCVLPANDTAVRELAPAPGACRRFEYGVGSPGRNRLGLAGTGKGARIVHAGTVFMRVGDSVLQRGFQLTNLLAALAMGHVLGLRPAAMRRGAAAFRGLPHRMQPVGVWRGVQWINDSKATNAAAAAAAVSSLPDPLVVIAGGAGKGLGYEVLRDALKGRNAEVVAIGAEGERIAAAVGSECNVSCAPSLGDAVAAARDLAQPGATVVLAPACASFDMFSNYQERGLAFERAVRAIH